MCGRLCGSEGGGMGGEAHCGLGGWGCRSGLFSIPSPAGMIDFSLYIAYYSLIGSNSATDNPVNPL